MVHPNRKHFVRISKFQKKSTQIAKRHLDENSSVNVTRNRIIAEQLSAQSTFGMESIGFRKCGRLNLGAKWGATTARASASLENYPPQPCHQ